MTERVAARVRSILNEEHNITVQFTHGISPESFRHSVRRGSATLLLHPVREPLILSIRGHSDT